MNSNLLPLMMEFEIRDFVLKQIMHTLTYMTFLFLSSTKTCSSTFKLRHSKSNNNIQIVELPTSDSYEVIYYNSESKTENILSTIFHS